MNKDMAKKPIVREPRPRTRLPVVWAVFFVHGGGRATEAFTFSNEAAALYLAQRYIRKWSRRMFDLTARRTINRLLRDRCVYEAIGYYNGKVVGTIYNNEHVFVGSTVVRNR